MEALEKKKTELLCDDVKRSVLKQERGERVDDEGQRKDKEGKGELLRGW